MGAVANFVTFFGGLAVMMVTLKSMDRLLYSLDETRDERIKEVKLHNDALHYQAKLLKERAEQSS